MFTDQLKEQTLESHQQLEKILITRIKVIQSIQEYVDLLQLFHGYFGGLEQKIEHFIDLYNYSERRKAKCLAADIKALGSKSLTTASPQYLPDINNELEAYGALYVIEGSTLGGKIISNMVATHLNITDGNGLSFFTGYGDKTEMMWLQFKRELNGLIIDTEQEQIVIAAANKTFLGFKQWIERKKLNG